MQPVVLLRPSTASRLLCLTWRVGIGLSTVILIFGNEALALPEISIIHMVLIDGRKGNTNRALNRGKKLL